MRAAAPPGGCSCSSSCSSSSRQAHHPLLHTQHRQRWRQCVRAAARGSGGGEPWDDTTRRALHEAVEILAEARELAAQQTLAELQGSWSADAAAAAAAADEPAEQLPPPSPPAAQEAFWMEQGLSSAQAARLVAEMAGDEAVAHLASTQLLASKLASLARVLPGADLPQLVARTPRVLAVPGGAAVGILVALVAGLPGCDAVDMVARHPRLLLLDPHDLPATLRSIVAKLVALHPSHSEHVVAGLLSDNPSLVERMPYYCRDDVRLLDDLPIEVQNMMVLGGKGLGLLHRFWANKQKEQQQQQGGGAANTPAAGEALS